jgi:tight adherence protein B
VKLVAGLLYFGAAALMIGLAVWLFLSAGRRGRQEGMLLRLRALGADDAKASFVAGERELRNPVLRAVCHAFWRSGVDVDPQTVARALWLLLVLVPLALMLLGLVAGLATLAAAAALAYAWLNQQAARRRILIVSQLPDFLESVIRVVSAGNTLEEAFSAAARETAEPLRGLFVSVSRQARLGAPIEQVLTETADIYRLRDIKVLALAASINRKYGGSLRNVLKSLIGTVRARDVAARELRALTAETRFSAAILAVIPVSLSIYILVQNPGYYTDMWADTAGRTTLIVSILLQVSGIVVIWRMMRSTNEGDAE